MRVEAKKHIDLIDILKGVAIISVLICHSVIVYPVNLEEVAWCNILKRFVDSYQMPLFFMISGFLCSYKGNYGGYLLARVKRILVPYIVFDAAALLLRVVGGSLVNRSMDIKSAIFQLFLQGTSAGGYWFLYTLFVISVIAPLFWVILKKNRLLGLPIIAVCVIVSALLDLPEICCLKSVVYYLTYFIIGMMLKGCDFGKIKKQAYRYPYSERSGVLSVIHSAENLCRQSVFCCRNIYIRAFGFGFLRLVLLFGENAEIHKESADDERKIFSPVLSAQRVFDNRLALVNSHKSPYHVSRANSIDNVRCELYCELPCIEIYS